MPEYLQCPQCHKRYAFPARLRGKIVRCKACGNRILVSDELPSGDPDEFPPQPAAPAPRLPATAVHESDRDDADGEYDLAPGVQVPTATSPAAPALAGSSRSRSDGPDYSSPESAVDTNASIAALRQHFFPNHDTAIRFYMRRRAATFSARCSQPVCASCGRETTRLRQFLWTCRSATTGISVSPWSLLTVFLGRVTVREHHRRYSFTTFHPLCPTCWTLLRLRRGFAQVCLIAASLLLVLGITCVGLTLTFRPNQVSYGVLIGLIFSLPAASAYLLAWWLWTPARFRFLRGGRFHLARTLG